MADTLLLDENWDLTLDSAGNIATTSGAYALAQDVASRLKTWLGEQYYDTTAGVPYRQSILGQFPNVQAIAGYLETQALLIDGVVSATATALSYSNRAMSWQVLITDTSGTVSSVTVGT